MCKQIIGDNKNCRWIAGNFDHHADAAVQCGVHLPMKHIQGFTRSHWMLPLGKCLCHIAPTAVTVHKIVENTQNTNKNYFQLATYGTINHYEFEHYLFTWTHFYCILRTHIPGSINYFCISPQPWCEVTLAPTMACMWGRPNQAHRRHPHTMDKDVCAWSLGVLAPQPKL